MGDLAYLDAYALESASETCIRCSMGHGWKTAALIYEGLEWNYLYCYDCKGWFARHYLYRYAVEKVNDPRSIKILVRQMNMQREMLEANLEASTFVRRTLSRARKLVRRLFSTFLGKSDV